MLHDCTYTRSLNKPHSQDQRVALSGASGVGNGNLLSIGYKVSDIQEECVLETCSTTLWSS